MTIIIVQYPSQPLVDPQNVIVQIISVFPIEKIQLFFDLNLKILIRH